MLVSTLFLVLALFAKHQINSYTHSGAKTQLSFHFVKKGKLDKKYGMLYGDFFDFEEQHITTLIPKVEEFLRKIETLALE